VQSGAIIAWKAIAKFKKSGENVFTIKEFCTLRRATTERENRAFFWFWTRSWNAFVALTRGER
jgi:hypothetical protein